MARHREEVRRLLAPGRRGRRRRWPRRPARTGPAPLPRRPAPAGAGRGLVGRCDGADRAGRALPRPRARTGSRRPRCSATASASCRGWCACPTRDAGCAPTTRSGCPCSPVASPRRGASCSTTARASTSAAAAGCPPTRKVVADDGTITVVERRERPREPRRRPAAQPEARDQPAARPQEPRRRRRRRVPRASRGAARGGVALHVPVARRGRRGAASSSGSSGCPSSCRCARLRGTDLWYLVLELPERLPRQLPGRGPARRPRRVAATTR